MSTFLRQTDSPNFIQLLVGLASFILISSVVASAAPKAQQILSSPAVFVRMLDLPGKGDHLLRPDQIFIDNRFNEVFVSDPGNNRVVVFDTSGYFKFDFSGKDAFATPSDIAVDSEGYIYVLGSSRSGLDLHVFDYDGLYLRKISFETLAAGDTVRIKHFTLDADYNICIVDEAHTLMAIFTQDGKLIRQFPLLTDLSAKLKSESSFGFPRVDGDLIYLPVSTGGSVYVYDLQGNFIRAIGYQGNNPGELNFPVGVAIGNDGIVAVLDKHRFATVCFTKDGKFLGEFGGMGTSPGWFYHPTGFGVDNEGRYYIGQVFLNRIQVCSLPEFIKANLEMSYETNSMNMELSSGSNPSRGGGRATF